MRCIQAVAVMFLLAFSNELIAQSPDWSINAPLDSIPDAPIRGRIFGSDFAWGSASISEHDLTIRSTKTLGSSLTIFAGTKELIKKRQYVVKPDSDGRLPHVHMAFPKKGRSSHGILMYTQQYSMRLTLLEKKAKTMKLALHISLPDYKKSFLVGTFEATIKS